MSQIAQFHRGYRGALRDVYHAMVLMLTRDKRRLAGLGIGEAVGDFAESLAILKDGQSAFAKEMRSGKDGLRCHQHFAGAGMDSSKREEFARGYRDGFDKAIEVLSASAWRMDHPPARLAIAELVARLERVRLELYADERHGSRFLKKRGYVLS